MTLGEIADTITENPTAQAFRGSAAGTGTVAGSQAILKHLKKAK